MNNIIAQNITAKTIVEKFSQEIETIRQVINAKIEKCCNKGQDKCNIYFGFLRYITRSPLRFLNNKFIRKVIVDYYVDCGFKVVSLADARSKFSYEQEIDIEWQSTDLDNGIYQQWKHNATKT